MDGRAAAIIREHEATHAALFERAARLAGKARRLEAAGTPSESASNRAERSRKEVEVELAALRTFFTTTTGEQGREAFNRQVRSRHPGLKLPDTGR